ncbi:ribosome maturation factor RimP [Proteiniclasticum sp. SCR006]|uniref:Ribosome maturation factor RimP n=2 Tax=Proteiniclasticum aestuarii TaxID=2817862 RepID=A0A939H9S9_9CLOT|nr:ribosome maturation factor RimP [Proteiniclasticum aestuarii]
MMAKLNDLEGLFTQEIEALGYRLYHMEYVHESGMNILRFYIDHDNGISLEDCEKVSRRLSDILDEKDPIAEDYNLEVSSPGIFRILFTRAHMQQALGEKVMVKTKKPVAGAKKFVGVLKEVRDHEVVILKEKNELEITFENLKSINIEVDL